MNAVLLAVSVFMNLVACGILRNDFCKREVESGADLYIFNAISSVVSAGILAVIALVGGSLGLPSLYTLIWGVVFGLATALCAIFALKALECGPLSYTNVIGSCAMVIPALSGMVLYGEVISPAQWIGIALMVVSFFCAVDKNNGESGASVKWMLFCLGSFLFSGMVGVLQKVHQSSPYRDELGIFLVIAFIVSAVFSLCLMLFYQSKGQKVTVLSSAKGKKFALVCLIGGLGVALCNQINMYLAGVMEAIIFYPVVNGASMILTAAAGLILWKERFSRKQWFGMIVGAMAIFLLCNIF